MRWGADGGEEMGSMSGKRSVAGHDSAIASRAGRASRRAGKGGRVGRPREAPFSCVVGAGGGRASARLPRRSKKRDARCLREALPVVCFVLPLRFLLCPPPLRPPSPRPIRSPPPPTLHLSSPNLPPFILLFWSRFEIHRSFKKKR